MFPEGSPERIPDLTATLLDMSTSESINRSAIEAALRHPDFAPAVRGAVSNAGTLPGLCRRLLEADIALANSPDGICELLAPPAQPVCVETALRSLANNPLLIWHVGVMELLLTHPPRTLDAGSWLRRVEDHIGGGALPEGRAADLLPQALVAGFTGRMPRALLSVITAPGLLEHAWLRCIAVAEDDELPQMLPAPIERFIWLHQPAGLPGIAEPPPLEAPSHVYETLWALATTDFPEDAALVEAELQVWSSVPRIEFLWEHPVPSDEGLRRLLALPTREYSIKLALRALTQLRVFPAAVMRDVLKHERSALTTVNPELLAQLERLLEDLDPAVVAPTFPTVFHLQNSSDLLCLAVRNGHTWRVVHLLQAVARVQARGSRIRSLQLTACLKRCLHMVALRQQAKVHDELSIASQTERHILSLASTWEDVYV
jgi:hypothetical protein